MIYATVYPQASAPHAAGTDRLSYYAYVADSAGSPANTDLAEGTVFVSFDPAARNKSKDLNDALVAAVIAFAAAQSIVLSDANVYVAGAITH